MVPLGFRGREEREEKDETREERKQGDKEGENEKEEFKKRSVELAETVREEKERKYMRANDEREVVSAGREAFQLK